MSLWVPLSFLVSALVYAIVGFGGGSTYAAVLAIASADHLLAPIIILLCNIVVVTGGVIHFYRADLLDVKQIIPLVLCSVPMAWVGGQMDVSQRTYLLVLGGALLLSGLLLLLEKGRPDVAADSAWPRKWRLLAPLLGGGLGFLAGLVGIGGGIFLAPLMHHLKVTSAKRIAATASLFILVNSIAGLIGQVMKVGVSTLTVERFGWLLLLPLVVLVGGQIGSRISIRMLSGQWIKKLTGFLVTVVGCRLVWANWVLS